MSDKIFAFKQICLLYCSFSKRDAWIYETKLSQTKLAPKYVFVQSVQNAIQFLVSFLNFLQLIFNERRVTFLIPICSEANVSKRVEVAQMQWNTF